ncbi:carboxylate--amine ligase [Carnobacteriaceae bacterium 52-44]
MQFKDREFLPVILGSDINTYSVARAFYEEYQVKSVVIGKYKSGPSNGSLMINYIEDVNIDQDSTFLKRIHQLSKEYKNKKIILLGAGDNYINMITKNRKQLPENIIVPFIPYELMNNLQKKDYFYSLSEEVGVDYPDTLLVSKEMGLNFEVPFEYPVILKSSESIHYWNYPFEGQEKVYIIQNREELNRTVEMIFNSGYPEKLIIQDMIPGNDEYMYVLTSYSDQSGKVVMMCLGNVLLEEHTPLGKGNHAVIITDHNAELMKQAKEFLENIHYVGFSNFDIKYDYRDGKYKFFEINTRQGRSNYYVTASGFNVARYLVEDYIYNNKMELELSKEPHLWMVVPKKVAFKYVKQEKNVKRMDQLIGEGKVVNPLFYKPDRSLHRNLRMLKANLAHYKKFEKYYQ